MAVELGNVVSEFRIEDTRVKFCDDYCKDKTQDQAKIILARIAAGAYRAIVEAERLAEENN